MNLAERWAAAWTDDNVDGLAELFTEKCEYEDVAFGVVNAGRDGVRAWAAGFLSSFPDLAVEPRRSFLIGDRGVLEWAMSGTHEGEFDGVEPSGRRFEVKGVTVFDFDAGAIERCSDYWNLGDVHRQLGDSR